MKYIFFYAAETFIDRFIMVLCKQTQIYIEAKMWFSGSSRCLGLKNFFLNWICNLISINIIDPHNTEFILKYEEIIIVHKKLFY